MYLPVVLEEAPVVRVKKAITQEVTGTETILIAEDDDAIRAIMCEALKLSGYNVISAGNGKEALIAGVNWKDIIHLLITDVIMPDMSGSKPVRVLKYFFHQGIPTIRLSTMAFLTKVRPSFRSPTALKHYSAKCARRWMLSQMQLQTCLLSNTYR